MKLRPRIRLGRRELALGMGVVSLSALGAVWLRANGDAPPTAEVKKGDWIDYVELRGEVKALRSISLSAPANAGELQLLKLLPSGTAVKTGDVVVEFDRTKRQRTLEEEHTALKQQEAEIEKARAQGRLKSEKNRTDVVKSRYDVDRAQLETRKAEVIAPIQGEKNRLDYVERQYRLGETEARAAADEVGASAEVGRASQKRNKALFDVQQGERAVSSMTLHAPVDGMVTILPNWRNQVGWGEAPEFKEGDRLWPGAIIAELPDLSSIRVTARVEEIDRGRVKVGQAAKVRVDAVPDREFDARVTEISPLAKLDFSNWPLTKSFDLVLELASADQRLRPGMSANARIAVEHKPDALLLPSQALFQKGGRTVVYVRGAWGFHERPVEIARRTPKQVAVARGLRPGERVALRDPTAKGDAR
jgi:RND family efflux transporter MFP subunit